MRRLGLVLGAAILLSGCGDDGASQEARSRLEGIIRDQLPVKAKRQGSGSVVVNAVQCTKAAENKYDCIATVRGADDGGAPATDVSIDGTCDDQSCIWKTAGGDLPVPAPSAQQSPAAGDGIEAVRARLENAGYTDLSEDEESGSDPGLEDGLVTKVGGARFKVLFFDSETAAARLEGSFQQLVQESPDQVAAKRKGSMVFVGTIEEPALLPKDKFSKFVAVAMGG